MPSLLNLRVVVARSVGTGPRAGARGSDAVTNPQVQVCYNTSDCGLLIKSGVVKATLLEDLMIEADDILSLAVATIKTARARKKRAIRNPQAATRSTATDAA